MFPVRILSTGFRSSALFVFVLLTFHIFAEAQPQGRLYGKVLDQLGNIIPQADIVLLQGDQEIVHESSNAQGLFELKIPTTGRCSLRVSATGFAPQTISSVLMEPGSTLDLTVSLHIGPLVQEIVVSATGTAMPESQVGASVSVMDNQEISSLNKIDALDNLRLIGGVQIVQTGQRGGTTSLFIRGGESNYNKILVDGVPVNAVGGAFDFAQLSGAGIGSMEVLRGSNSVLYGSDAMSGVVNFISKTGSTEFPELQYSVDGGNWGTLRQDVSLGGLIHNFDYFSEFSRFDTQGSVPNSYFHNASINANLGWQLNSTTRVRATVRHANTGLGAPNAYGFYGIADNSWQANHNTYVGATAQQQTTEKWHNIFQFAFSQYTSLFVNPSPTGEAFDPLGFGPNYLGKVVTIHGANGYSAAGPAILDYGGAYPQQYPNYEARRSTYAQSDYQFRSNLSGVFGFRYEHENGSGFTRNNYSAVMEGHGNIGRRLFATFGVGLEHNSFFGFAASPRVSAAYYLRRPSNAGFFGETKFKLNYGNGIKEASTLQQASSLINLLIPSQISKYNVSPLKPERSRTFDFGVEQGFLKTRSLLGITFFHNQFHEMISYLDPISLISIGVPAELAYSTPYGGAFANATSEHAFGCEVSLKTDLGHGFLVQGEYAYLDAHVEKSFAEPVFNPEFPTIPIGAFAPLKGERPFYRAPHSGSLRLFFTRNRLNAALSSYFIGRNDASTFLYDGYFGSSLLLPNRNLSPGYQKIDLSASYTLKPYLTLYTSIENLLSQHYQSTFGYPALPFGIRSGLKITIGGSRDRSIR